MYVYLFVFLLGVAISGGGMFKLQNWRHDSQEKERMEAVAEKSKFDRLAVDNAAAGHEKDKESIRAVTRKATKEVEKLVREPFYVQSEQCFDDAGMAAIKTATDGGSTPTAPASSPSPSEVRQ